MDISREQLRHYANVICAWQAGDPADEIAVAFKLPESVVTAWLVNFLEAGR